MGVPLIVMLSVNFPTIGSHCDEVTIPDWVVVQTVVSHTTRLSPLEHGSPVPTPTVGSAGGNGKVHEPTTPFAVTTTVCVPAGTSLAFTVTVAATWSLHPTAVQLMPSASELHPASGSPPGSRLSEPSKGNPLASAGGKTSASPLQPGAGMPNASISRVNRTIRTIRLYNAILRGLSKDRSS